MRIEIAAGAVVGAILLLFIFIYTGCQRSATSLQETLGQEKQLVSPLELGLDVVNSAYAPSSVVSPVAFYDLFDLMRIGAEGEIKQLLEQYQMSFDAQAQIKKSSSSAYFLRLSDVWADISREFSSWYGDTINSCGYMFHSLPWENAEDAMSSINGWIDEMTQGELPDYFSREGYQPFVESEVLFTNAAKFIAGWKHPLNKYEEGVFHQRPDMDNPYAEGTQRVETFVSSSSCEGWYAENENEQVLALPYEDAAYRLMIVLPRNPIQAERPWEAYSYDRLKELEAGLQKVSSIDVHLVKFQTTENVYLSVPESELEDEGANITGVFANLRHLFTTPASYPKMFTEPAAIDLAPIMQECMFEITAEGSVSDENGLPEGALPGVELSANAAHSFVTDRPFLYILYREDLGIDNALFVGSYE